MTVSPQDDLAIRQVVLRYCRGVDRMDADLVRSCYHADATDSHGTFSGGLEEFMVWLWRVLGRYSMTMHYIANQLVEPAGDGRARCESYGMAIHRTDGGEPRGNLTTGFRFVDDFVRRGGEWRIARRVATAEWVRVERPDDVWPIAPSMVTGRRDRTDALYAPWAG